MRFRAWRGFRGGYGRLSLLLPSIVAGYDEWGRAGGRPRRSARSAYGWGSVGARRGSSGLVGARRGSPGLAGARRGSPGLAGAWRGVVMAERLIRGSGLAL